MPELVLLYELEPLLYELELLLYVVVGLGIYLPYWLVKPFEPTDILRQLAVAAEHGETNTACNNTHADKIPKP